MIDIDKKWLEVSQDFLSKSENDKVRWLNHYGWAKLEYVIRSLWKNKKIDETNYKELVKICLYGFDSDYFLPKDFKGAKPKAKYFRDIGRLNQLLGLIERSLKDLMNEGEEENE